MVDFKKLADEAKKQRAAELVAERAVESASPPVQSKREEQLETLIDMANSPDPFNDWEIGFIDSVTRYLKSSVNAYMSEKQEYIYRKLVEKFHEYYE